MTEGELSQCQACGARGPDVYDRTGEQSDLCDSCAEEYGEGCEKHFSVKAPLACPVCLMEEVERLRAEGDGEGGGREVPDAFRAGISYGVDWADAHDPDDGHATPTRDDIGAMYDDWNRRTPEPTRPEQPDETDGLDADWLVGLAGTIREGFITLQSGEAADRLDRIASRLRQSQGGGE